MGANGIDAGLLRQFISTDILSKGSLETTNYFIELVSGKVLYPVPFSVLKLQMGNSLAVQWLRLCAFIAMGPGSVPGWGAKILQAAWRGQKKKQLQMVEG